MTEYTISIIYDWSIHKNEIKKLLQDNYLIWNSSKLKNLTNDELKDELKKFKIDTEFDIPKNITGSSGIYEDLNENKNETILIKMIRMLNTDIILDVKYTLNIDNMILIYKGICGEFYKELFILCKNLGCLVIKIVDDEIVFKNKINIELIKNINNIESEKNIKIQNFKIKSELLDLYSDDFKNKWIELLKNN